MFELHCDLVVCNELPDVVVLDLDVPSLLASDGIVGNGSKAGAVLSSIVTVGWSC